MSYLTIEDLTKRERWINYIKDLSFKNNFILSTELLQKELLEEVTNSPQEILTHLRLCGNIPEEFTHDSKEEKLYSKYTDTIISYALESIGIKSIVLTERSDAADVESVANGYSFISDAKAFRLSRTAKNQKDFKVKSMDNWKRGKPYALLICPIYQLPQKNSQIYRDASTVNVCIFTYSHLSLLVNYGIGTDIVNSERLLHRIFQTVDSMNPSKSSIVYWQIINNLILQESDVLSPLWKIEKEISVEALQLAKSIDLKFLANERKRFMQMTHDEAVKELIKISKLENKIDTINSIKDNGLFDIK